MMRWLALVVACSGCDALFRVDAITVQDAAVDASLAPGSDALAGFCMNARTNLLCADFDTDATGLGPFTQLPPVNAQLARGSPSYSPPFALIASSPASMSGAQAYATFPISDTQFHGEIQLEANVTAACGQTFIELELGGESHFGLTVNSTATGFDGTLTGPTCAVSSPIPAKLTQWNEIILDVDVPGDTVTATVDGSMTPLACPPQGTAAGTTFTLGVAVGGNHVGCEMLFDNVLVFAN
jgi:hypothetical protein